MIWEKPESGAMAPRFPILILEGPDGAGKTTLADQLIARSPQFAYHHEGPPPLNLNATDYYLALLERIITAGQPTIIDRFALGERVYGPILRGIDRIGVGGYHRIHVRLKDVGALTVICLPPPDVALDNWRTKVAQKREMISNPTTYLKTYAAFAHFLSVSDAIAFDYTVDSLLGLSRRCGITS